MKITKIHRKLLKQYPEWIEYSYSDGDGEEIFMTQEFIKIFLDWFLIYGQNADHYYNSLFSEKNSSELKRKKEILYKMEFITIAEFIRYNEEYIRFRLL